MNHILKKTQKIVKIHKLPLTLWCQIHSTIYITHSLQLPGGKGKSADGRSSQAKVLGTAAAAIGLAGFFIEVHPSPEDALCDGASATRLSEFESLLLELKKFDELSKSL